MKVLFTFGGLPHYYNLVLNKLNRINNIEIVVVVPAADSNTIGEGVYQTNKDAEFKIIHLREFKSWYGKVFFQNLNKLILNEKPEIIVTGWPYSIGFLLNLKIKAVVKKLNVKIILKEIPFGVPKYDEAEQYYFEGLLKDEDLKSIKYKKNLIGKLNIKLITFIRKKIFNLADAHVNYIEKAYEILPSYGVPKEKIFITYNSPDTEKLLSIKDEINNESTILPENPYRIIHVGRLVKWKKVDLLINAFSKIKEKFPDAELLIIGTGPEKSNLEKLTGELGLEANVKFIGGVYDSKILGKYLAVSSIYVLAGMGGLSINEAMSFGKPIVCSICDGTEKHLVFDDFNGKYFEEDNEDDLVKKIIELFENPQEIKTMGQNSVKIIREKINIDIVVSGYLKAFNYVTGKS